MRIEYHDEGPNGPAESDVDCRPLRTDDGNPLWRMTFRSADGKWVVVDLDFRELMLLIAYVGEPGRR